MQITVERSGELVLCAPPEVDEAALRAFVLEKRFWIYTKLAEKDRLQRQVPRKEFVGGEGFLYLGRSHRLKLVDEQDVPLKLATGRFCLRRDALASRARALHPLVQRACQGVAVEPGGRLPVAHGGRTCRREGARPGLPLGIVRQGRLAVLPLEDDPAAGAHRRVRGGARDRPPARAAPHARRSGCAWSAPCLTIAQRKAWLAEHGIDVEGI